MVWVAAILSAFIVLLFTTSAAFGKTEGKREKIVRIAFEKLDSPYVFGATGPSRFDCSGLTRYLYHKLGIELPHFAASQFDRGRRVARRFLKPGDLLFFHRLGHVGVYVGKGKFIHASSARGRVVLTRLSRYTGFVGAKRLSGVSR